MIKMFPCPCGVAVLVAVALAVTLLASVGAGQEQLAVRPNILFITLDTLRADALGCYGARQDPTPHLDRLAGRGVRFDQALAPCPITLPSHATMLTGLYPPEHGLRDNSPRALSPSVPLVTEAFRNRSYRTAAFLSAEPVARKWGLHRGFETYNDVDRETRGLTPSERRGGDTVDAAAKWIEVISKFKRPFFCWVHLFDPHHPYRAPAEFAKRFDHPYTAEVAYTDACVGRLLEAVTRAGREKNTVVIVVGDHGEGLGDHGESTHAHLVHGSTIRVPLLIAGVHGATAGRVVHEPVSLVDLAPTLYHILGESPPRVSGVSLLDAIRSKDAEPPRRPLYVESLYDFLHFGWAPLYAVRLGPRYLVQADKTVRLYDLTSDSGELTDLAGKNPDDLRPLRIQLRNLRTSLDRAPQLPPGTAKLDAPPGYLQAPHARPTLDKDKSHFGKRRIPMDVIGEITAFEDVKRKSSAKDPAGLLNTLAQMAVLLERDPDNPGYLFWKGRLHRNLGLALDDHGREPEEWMPSIAKAGDCFRRVLNRRATHVGAQNSLFQCMLILRRSEVVIRGTRTVIDAGHEHRDTRFWLAHAYLQRGAKGDLDRADAANREGLRRFPGYPRLLEQRKASIEPLLLRRKVEERKRRRAGAQKPGKALRGSDKPEK